MSAGRGKLNDILSAEFWWPTMATDVNIFVGHCHVCLSNRTCRVSNHVVDGQFDQIVQPSEEVVADPVGPLLLMEEWYCYILVLVDRASRWIEAYPMKANTAESLLTAFLLFIWRRGCPEILYTDRGVNLLSFFGSQGICAVGDHESFGVEPPAQYLGHVREDYPVGVDDVHVRHGGPAAPYHLVRAGASHSLAFEHFGLGLDGLPSLLYGT